MSRLPSVPEQLWRRAAGAAARLLMLDYDGTLAPLRVDRLAAVPPRGLLRTLRAIADSGTTGLAIVSGRPVEEVAGLIGDLPARLFGEHGWETRTPDGRAIQYPLPVTCRRSLDQAAAAAGQESWSGRIETKRTGLVLHTRGLPDDEARAIETACETLWKPTARGGGLRFLRIDGGIELTARGRSKRTAVREAIAASPEGVLPVYIGDDETDEDAFESVRATGFGLLVSSEARDTRASGSLGSIQEVGIFLQEWLKLTRKGRETARRDTQQARPT